MERSVVERLAKIKAIVISYELWMSYKKEEICSLMANYFTVPDRNNSHIVMPYITDTDDVSLSKYVMEVVDNFGLEENIVGIISDDGGNIQVCREVMESKYSNDSVFHQPIPSSSLSALHKYWKVLVRQECNRLSRMVVRLTLN